jgi:hypothetical protein
MSVCGSQIELLQSAGLAAELIRNPRVIPISMVECFRYKEKEYGQTDRNT